MTTACAETLPSFNTAKSLIDIENLRGIKPGSESLAEFWHITDFNSEETGVYRGLTKRNGIFIVKLQKPISRLAAS